jgi:tetratricopeptide (TPR) repeat protein
MRSGRLTIIVWALVGVFLVGGLAASTVRVQKFTVRPYLHESLYLPSGNLISQLSLGYKQVVSDLVWFSAIQYYGDYRLDRHGLNYFKGLIDIVVTLDPNFIFAYEFGAMVVSEDMGHFEEGIDILKRGMGENPTSWRLPFEIGFLYYLHQVNFDMAARYFDLASRMPEAPERAKRFAAFVYWVAGQQASALKLWEEYAEYTENPYLKELAKSYVEKLKQSEPIQPWKTDDR